MSQASFFEFILLTRGNVPVLARYNRRSLSELIFHAKNEGFDFTADDVAEVIGKLEANIIQVKDRDPYDETSRLWRQMWGKRHLEYLIGDVVNRYTDEELRSLVESYRQEVV